MHQIKDNSSRPPDADLIIVGASFAGLAAARTAAMRGLRTIVIDAMPGPGARIHTTGILVREAIDEIDIPFTLTRRHDETALKPRPGGMKPVLIKCGNDEQTGVESCTKYTPKS